MTKNVFVILLTTPVFGEIVPIGATAPTNIFHLDVKILKHLKEALVPNI